MKNIIFPVLLLFLFSTCKKDKFDEQGFYGQGTANLDGRLWSGKTGIFPAKSFCTPDTCVGIILINQEKDLEQRIIFDQVSLKLGKYRLNYVWPIWGDVRYKISYVEAEAGGERPVAGYEVFENNEENFLEITSLNLKTGHMGGRFQATVVRDSFSVVGPKGFDTLRITNGTFYGRINWDR